MQGIVFIEPTELYNLLNQVTNGFPCLVNEYYLVLFDTRKLEEYSESHVITSRHIQYSDKHGYTFPMNININYSAVKNLVVIDSRASSIKDITSPAIVCAEMLWNMGSKYPVKIVQGGYEEFSGLYPFLRSQKRLWTQREVTSLKTYPIEVEPGFLYIGTYEQACCLDIGKKLKIKAHVNVTTHEDPRFSMDDTIPGKNREPVSHVLNVPVNDNVETSIASYFSVLCSFIDQHRKNDCKAVLIYSDLGISRCITVALCYIIHKHKIPLKEAIQQVSHCHHSICPNKTFIKSLLKWEGEVLGSQVTIQKDLGFLSYY